MGLDQYLYGIRRDKEHNIYWRKSNQIHRWFDQNLESVPETGIKDLAYYHVKLSELKTLLALCSDVLNHKDQAYSAEHLPTTTGFFFGSTDYDDYYYMDLEETVQSLKTLLADPNLQGALYKAWW